MKNNIAGDDGGAISLDVLSGNTNAITIADCDFTSNSAGPADSSSGPKGGAIFVLGNSGTDGQNMTVDSCTFDSNAGLGGALFTQRVEEVFFQNNAVMDNTTPDGSIGAAGLHLTMDNSAGETHLLTVANNVFADNADTSGTIDGIGFYSLGDLVVMNNIFIGHRDTISYLGASPGSSQSNTYSGYLAVVNNVFDTLAGAINTTPTVELDNIEANPLFTDAPNGDFTLQAGSPAINLGVASFVDSTGDNSTNAPTVTFDNNPRPPFTNDAGIFQTVYPFAYITPADGDLGNVLADRGTTLTINAVLHSAGLANVDITGTASLIGGSEFTINSSTVIAETLAPGETRSVVIDFAVPSGQPDFDYSTILSIPYTDLNSSAATATRTFSANTNLEGSIPVTSAKTWEMYN